MGPLWDKAEHNIAFQIIDSSLSQIISDWDVFNLIPNIDIITSHHENYSKHINKQNKKSKLQIKIKLIKLPNNNNISHVKNPEWYSPNSIKIFERCL